MSNLESPENLEKFFLTLQVVFVKVVRGSLAERSDLIITIGQ